MKENKFLKDNDKKYNRENLRNKKRGAKKRYLKKNSQKLFTRSNPQCYLPEVILDLFSADSNLLL